MEHVDVLIVGAGLSGIGAACQLKSGHPDRSVAILEARDASGGTWDLFRYPGIRSDSDMFTFGYRWRPWPGDVALAGGADILDYVRTVAEEYEVDKLIRYRFRVTGADWDSATARWTVQIDQDGAPLTMTASFLWGCTGYYDYDEGHAPVFPGVEEFAGEVVYPQFWPEDLDYAGKKVVVIGSGATAVTLVPSMAPTAGHVTMLQRTPTYILPQPGTDSWAKRLAPLPGGDRLPDRALEERPADGRQLSAGPQVPRAGQGGPAQARRARAARGHVVRRALPAAVRPLGPAPVRRPRRRLLPRRCAPARPTIVTDTIETFTPTGIRLTSGAELEADIIVSATGLKLKLFGGIDLSVDGVVQEQSSQMTYKGLMVSGLPNFAFTMGYTNASWTLKADLVGEYVVRLLAHLDRAGLRSAVPVKDPTVGERPFMDLASGYIQRALDGLPRQGDRAPWQLKQNYLVDVRTIRRNKIDDGVLRFTA